MITTQNKNLVTMDRSTNTAYYPRMECCKYSGRVQTMRRGIYPKATEFSNIQRLSDVHKAAKLDWNTGKFFNQHVVRKKSDTENNYGA